MTEIICQQAKGKFIQLTMEYANFVIKGRDLSEYLPSCPVNDWFLLVT